MKKLSKKDIKLMTKCTTKGKHKTIGDLFNCKHCNVLFSKEVKK